MTLSAPSALAAATSASMLPAAAVPPAPPVLPGAVDAPPPPQAAANSAMAVPRTASRGRVLRVVAKCSSTVPAAQGAHALSSDDRHGAGRMGFGRPMPALPERIVGAHLRRAVIGMQAFFARSA